MRYERTRRDFASRLTADYCMHAWFMSHPGPGPPPGVGDTRPLARHDPENYPRTRKIALRRDMAHDLVRHRCLHVLGEKSSQN